MDPVRNILVIVDPTVENAAAVTKAARLATATGARVELHICDFTPALDAARHPDAATHAAGTEPVAARHQLHLDRLAASLRAAGVDAGTSVDFGNPLHAAIVRKVRAARPDLVVKDTHYHGALRRAFYTNTDWQLIRECPVPLLLARQAPWQAAPTVAAAIDPNHPLDTGARLDHDIIAAATALGAAIGGRVCLVNVFSTLNLMSLGAGTAVAPAVAVQADFATLEALRTLRRTQLDGLAAEHAIARADAFLVDGITSHALPEFVAEHQVDLLVMGAIARGRLHELFIGSTAERVLDRLACDLLIVRPRAA
jgi:universal stress protein E